MFVQPELCQQKHYHMKQIGFPLAKAILLIEGQIGTSLTAIQYEDGSRRKFNVEANGWSGFIELDSKGRVVEATRPKAIITQAFTTVCQN
jgi:hypothetical protein